MLADFIRESLEDLRTQHLVRTPPVIERIRGPYVTIDGRELLCFCSNDYLGIAQDLPDCTTPVRDFGWGAASSRALSGTSTAHELLEKNIAAFKRAPAALFFSSGYMANLGLITTIADRETLIVADELNHASLIDSCRLSRARVEIYPHRNVQAAKRLLEIDAKRKFILTDTVFSMDGDLAPLDELQRLGVDVVVDDVHGLGVFGERGRGCTQVPIQTGNLSKAAGGIGGFVVGSRELIELLRSRARTFLFTTAPPPAVCNAGSSGLLKIQEAEEQRQKLWKNLNILGAVSPIRSVIVGSNEAALRASERLRELGFFVPAIRPPTVAPGTARLRITVTAMHEPSHVEALLDALKKI
jgi:glycine C-acetyltransferase/8-amino-7-oxononanoate synthase